MKIRILLLAFTASVLIGCSDSSEILGAPTVPTEPIRITASNANAIAGGAMDTTESITALADSTGGVVTGAAASAASSVGLLQATLESFYQVYNGSAWGKGISASAVASPAPICSSGSASVVHNDTNTNSQWDQGESVEISYNSCVLIIDSTSVTLDGDITLTLSTLTGDPSTGTSAGDWDFALTVVYANYSLTISDVTMSVTGDVTVGASYANPSVTQSISGTSMSTSVVSTTQSAAATLSNFSFDATNDISSGVFTLNADYTLASSELGGSITVVTGPNPPTEPIFSGNIAVSEIPSVGIMVITGAANSAVKLDANTGNINTVGIWLDENGDGSFVHLGDVLWSSL